MKRGIPQIWPPAVALVRGPGFGRLWAEATYASREDLGGSRPLAVGTVHRVERRRRALRALGGAGDAKPAGQCEQHCVDLGDDRRCSAADHDRHDSAWGAGAHDVHRLPHADAPATGPSTSGRAATPAATPTGGGRASAGTASTATTCSSARAGQRTGGRRSRGRGASPSDGATTRPTRFAALSVGTAAHAAGAGQPCGPRTEPGRAIAQRPRRRSVARRSALVGRPLPRGRNTGRSSRGGGGGEWSR